MSSALLRFYQSLPPSARSLAASMRGYYLRAWRFGPRTEAIVETALERDHWSASRWQEWEQDRLARLLDRAATRVPYYRDAWQARRRAGDRASWEVLSNWPILSKEQLRAQPAAFVADDCERSRMMHEHTSGTTGKPLDLWFTRDTVQQWYAVHEARVRRWFGVSYRDRWGHIGGQPIIAFDRTRPPFWVWNAGLRQLYLSSYHLAKANVPAYLAAMRDHRIVFAFGYSSSLHSLAHLASELGLSGPKLALVTTNAEPLLGFQREAIAKVFGTTPRETYGMSEIACAAGECEAGRMHVWPDVGVIEVVSDQADTAVSAGETGRIVCTGLLNVDMPLIRYEVGDRGALASPEARCACRRTLPLMERVEGRLDDVLITRDGRRIGRLDVVFKSSFPIREAQIIQEQLDSVRMLVVPAPGYSETTATALAESLRERMGDIAVAVEPVRDIPRTANGKFRAVINRVPTIPGSSAPRV